MKGNGGIIGSDNTPTTNAASGVWGLRQILNAVSDEIWPGLSDSSGPPVPGYVAWYTAESVNGTTWGDLSTNGNDATISGSGYSVVSTTGNGASLTFDVLEGTVNSAVTFPSAILPSTYTLFHVARYTGGSRERIFNGSGNNWLSGFWNGNAGVAYHDGWLTPQTDIHVNNWVYSTDQNGLYRSNGVQRSTSSGGGTSTSLRVNAGEFSSEISDFMIAEVIVYDSQLSSSEYQQVESYLSNKYGI